MTKSWMKKKDKGDKILLNRLSSSLLQSIIDDTLNLSDPPRIPERRWREVGQEGGGGRGDWEMRRTSARMLLLRLFPTL